MDAVTNPGRELSRRNVEYIVVGGMAGVLHGAPVVTADLDIVHRRTQENVAKLLELLNELQAIFRGDDRRLKPNESHLLDQLEVKVVGLEKLIELKAAAGRPKGQIALPVLRATLEETKRRR